MTKRHFAFGHRPNSYVSVSGVMELWGYGARLWPMVIASSWRWSLVGKRSRTTAQWRCESSANYVGGLTDLWRTLRLMLQTCRAEKYCDEGDPCSRWYQLTHVRADHSLPRSRGRFDRGNPLWLEDTQGPCRSEEGVRLSATPTTGNRSSCHRRQEDPLTLRSGG